MQALFLLITVAVLVAVFLCDVLTAILDPRDAGAKATERSPPSRLADRRSTPAPAARHGGRGGASGAPSCSNGKALTGDRCSRSSPSSRSSRSWFTSVDHPSSELRASACRRRRQHWLGTTAFGQDVLAQLIYGTRESLVIAFAVGALATLLR